MPPPRRVKVTNSHILPPYKTNILAAKIATIMRYGTTYKRPSMAAWKRQYPFSLEVRHTVYCHNLHCLM